MLVVIEAVVDVRATAGHAHALKDGEGLVHVLPASAVERPRQRPAVRAVAPATHCPPETKTLYYLFPHAGEQPEIEGAENVKGGLLFFFLGFRPSLIIHYINDLSPWQTQTIKVHMELLNACLKII